MNAALEFLQGKKTYLIVALALGTILKTFLDGDVTAGDAVFKALEALGLGTLRAGVAKAAS